jgi:hypothetical protein
MNTVLRLHSTEYMMPSAADSRVEPDWVLRMREAGYDVRMEISAGGLPETPEMCFTLPRATRIGLRRRVKTLARKLWGGRDFRR